MPSSPPALIASGLGRRFGRVEAVQGVDLRVERGEVLGLLGPNGAGKSTTLRMLAGDLAPTRGSGSIAGFDLVAQAPQARANVGYAPEEPALDPELTAFAQLRFAAALHGRPAQAAHAALAAADLVGMSSTRIGSLSRGVRRRLGVAQALVHEPAVLLLDEPAAGLDPNRRMAMRELLRGAADRGAAVLLSTHLLEDAEALCDRVVVVRDGAIVGEGRPGARVPGPRWVRLRLQAPPPDVLARLTGTDGVASVDAGADGALRVLTADVPGLARVCAAWGLLELTPEGTLEALYLASEAT